MLIKKQKITRMLTKWYNISTGLEKFLKENDIWLMLK